MEGQHAKHDKHAKNDLPRRGRHHCTSVRNHYEAYFAAVLDMDSVPVPDSNKLLVNS